MPVPSFRRYLPFARTLAAGLACLAGSAFAAPCYVVLDRNDAVVYQSPQPPVDMSSEGNAARDAMRRRGDVLLNFDSSNCAVRVLASRSGNAEATVDEIVSSVKPYKTARTSNVVGGTTAGGTMTGDAPINVSVGR